MVDNTTLAVAGKARSVLGEAAKALGDAIAAPFQHSERWHKQVGADLDDLRTALRRHIEITEGDDGLLAEILDDAPRLAPAVDVVLADHGELCEAVDLVLDMLDEDQPSHPHDIRPAVLELLSRLAAHRHRGADLVYDAYNIDIGGLDGS